MAPKTTTPVTSLQLARLGLLRAKPLPRRVFARMGFRATPDPRAWLDAKPARVTALAAVLRAIEEIDTFAERMHVLAACAALHDDPDEAAWFLALAVEDEHGGRCGRCGRAAPLSRWRNNP